MNFNIGKCIVIKCSRAQTIIPSTYILHGQILESRLYLYHPYLGVTISSTWQWSQHITDVINKASKTLNFLRYNLYKCSEDVKVSASLTIVRSLLEYASLVWDPHHITYIAISLKRYSKEQPGELLDVMIGTVVTQP